MTIPSQIYGSLAKFQSVLQAAAADHGFHATVFSIESRHLAKRHSAPIQRTFDMADATTPQAIALVIPDRKLEQLQQQLSALLPDVPVWIYPEIPNPEAVAFAVVWKQPPGSLASMPNLKALQSFGAGVDNILSDLTLPHLPLARIVDPDLASSMVNYVDTMVRYYRLRLDLFATQQQQGLWKPKSARRLQHICVLGLGELGGAVARHFLQQGYTVSGWSYHQKHIDGVRCYAKHTETTPDSALQAALQDADVVVCLLPHTPETDNLLNATRLGYCKTGAVLINVARGAILDDEALLHALDRQALSAACLDVFRQEPLPAAHPFWQHPAITLTPHISAVTNATTAVAQIAENYQRAMANQPLLHPVDVSRGY